MLSQLSCSTCSHCLPPHWVSMKGKAAVLHQAPLQSSSCSAAGHCRPATEEGKAKLQQLLDDLHNSFKDLVKQSRGQALKGNDDDLFTGKMLPPQQCFAFMCRASTGHHEHSCSVRMPVGISV